MVKTSNLEGNTAAAEVAPWWVGIGKMPGMLFI